MYDSLQSLSTDIGKSYITYVSLQAAKIVPMWPRMSLESKKTSEEPEYTVSVGTQT